MRELLTTLPTCEGGWEKPYESGRTPFWKKLFKVQPFPKTSQLAMVWVAKDQLRGFWMMLRLFISWRKHGYSLTVSLLLEDILLHQHLHLSPTSRPQRTDSIPIGRTTARWQFCNHAQWNSTPFQSWTAWWPCSSHCVDFSSNTGAITENVSMNPEEPPIETRMYRTPHLVCHLAGEPISNVYFGLFNDEIDIC